MKYFRFNLATLLVVMGLIALPLGYLSQAGFAKAQLEIQSNQLLVDSGGVLRGDLVCLCSIPGKETTKMICRIEQSHLADLKLLEPEATFRFDTVGILRLGCFPSRIPKKLGFDAQDVVGQMKMVDESVVLVRQK